MLTPEPNKPDAASKKPAVAKHLPAEPLNALSLLKALRRRWLAATLLGVVVAGAAFAAVWYFLPPPDYYASTKFFISSKPPSMLFAHPENSQDFEAFQSKQVATIKHRLLLNTALRQAKAESLKGIPKGVEKLDWLEKELHIDFPNGPEILRLSLLSDDQETCKALVTEVAAAYLQQVKTDTDAQRAERLGELRKIVERFEVQVKRLREDVHTKAKLAGGGSDVALALKQVEALEQAQAARHELVAAQSRLRTLETEEDLAQKRPPAAVEVSDAALNDFIDKRPEIAKLLKDKADLEDLIQQMLPHAVAKEKDAEIRKVAAHVKEIDESLEKRRADLREECKKLLQEQVARQQGARADERRHEIEETKALRDNLLKDSERLSQEAKEFNEAALDLGDLKPELADAEAVALRGAQEMTELTVEQDAPPRVIPWEEVIVTRPDELDRKVKAAAGAAAAAFLLALLLVAFLEFRARRVCAPQEVEQGLGINLVGTVPARPSLRGASRNGHWHALLAESVDSSRTMLLHGTGAGTIQVVMVTSAVGGEGKTSLAGHLAVSLARSGRRTLLIDGDLRSPAVHRLFDVRPGPGFSELLRGELQVSDVLCPTGVPGLQVLTAGACNLETLSRLSQGGAEAVLAGLKESFDFIVLDSSPILPVTDALLLARHVDGVLFSILQNVSTTPAVHEAYQRLESLGVVLLGAVVSGVRPDVSSYGRRRYLSMAASGQ